VESSAGGFYVAAMLVEEQGKMTTLLVFAVSCVEKKLVCLVVSRKVQLCVVDGGGEVCPENRKVGSA
jgi:hypothetical protein